MRTIKLALAILAASALGHAEIFTVNESITLNSSAITSASGNEFYNQQFSVASPVSVQAGDEITGTVSFTNGPVLIASPPGDSSESVAIFFSPQFVGGTTHSTDNVDFLGLNGDFPETNPTPIFNNSGGPFVALQQSNGQAFDFSFTGFTYTINIDSLVNGLTPYYFSQLSLEGQTLEFGVSAAAPEPSSLALCALGCAVLYLALRRKLA
jgi:hypothetical protein